MFEVGDRVVCVDDSDQFNVEADHVCDFFEVCFLKLRAVYVVLAVLPDGSNIVDDMGDGYLIGDHIAVGVPDQLGLDAWEARRFRKLRDISQSLAELKALTINCPPLVSA
jgi:hypothetical protein